MVIGDKNSDSIELIIERYEFPQNTTDEYDSNWLYVRFNATQNGRAFSASSPSLSTVDINAIAQWLRELPRTNELLLEFLEPEYRFLFLGKKGDVFQIRVLLEISARPKWQAECFPYCNDCWLDLQLTEEQVLGWANDLEEQLSRFPIRALPKRGIPLGSG